MCTIKFDPAKNPNSKESNPKEPNPNESNSKESNPNTTKIMKVACFFCPFNEEANIPEYKSRVHWQNKYLTACNVENISFYPDKKVYTPSSANNIKYRDENLAHNLLDRISVILKITLIINYII